MALLAGPKRKQKISADPNNRSWSQDTNAFGHSMLKKMGWTEGKGLGANETGNVAPVKASMKMNTYGLGCTAADADAWIAHQEGFDEVLALLNSTSHGGDSDTAQTSNTKPENASTESEGAKRFYGRYSRSRVQKQRTAEDLDCIFGRRKTKSAPASPEHEQKLEIQPREGDTASDGESEKDKTHGFVTVKSSCSVQDYFAKKMKEKGVGLPSVKTEIKEEPTDDMNSNRISSPSDFVKTETNEEHKDQEPCDKNSYRVSSCSVQDYFKQKMKAKKAALSETSKAPSIEQTESTKTETEHPQSESCTQTVSKTAGNKKKRKKACFSEEEAVEAESKIKDSKKSKKRKIDEESAMEAEDESKLKTKKKKKRRKGVDEDEVQEDLNISEENAMEVEEIKSDSKKRKKRKGGIVNEVETQNNLNIPEEITSLAPNSETCDKEEKKDKKKKNKKKRNSPENDDSDENCDKEKKAANQKSTQVQHSDSSTDSLSNDEKRLKLNQKFVALEKLVELKNVKYEDCAPQMNAVPERIRLLYTKEVLKELKEKLASINPQEKKLKKTLKGINELKKLCLAKILLYKQSGVDELNKMEESALKVIKTDVKKIIAEVKEMSQNTAITTDCKDAISDVKQIKKELKSRVERAKRRAEEDLDSKMERVRTWIGKNADTEAILERKGLTHTALFPGATDVAGYAPMFKL